MPISKFRRLDMRRKLVLFGLSAGIMVTALFLATPATATDATGFFSTTIARGRFSEFSAFNQFIPPATGPDWKKPNIWRSRQRTKGLSDGFVLNNAWDKGGSTGWHTHPGHTLIIVTLGTITEYHGDDPTCTGTVYTAGMTFVDQGDGHVHIVRNETNDPAQVVAIRLIPAGQPGRIDAPDPGNCHFPPN
jgi:quercetin dioxygenase-like cupin family protein